MNNAIGYQILSFIFSFNCYGTLFYSRQLAVASFLPIICSVHRQTDKETHTAAATIGVNFARKAIKQTGLTLKYSNNK